MNKLLKIALLGAVGTAASCLGQVVTYQFSSVAPGGLAPTSTAANVSATSFTSVVGTPGISSGAMAVSGVWQSGGSVVLDGTSYVEFTVTPNSGFLISITSLTFDIATPTSGITTLGANGDFAVAIGLNGSSAAETGVTIVDNSIPQSATLGSRTATISGIGNLTSAAPTSFRIYAFNTDGNGQLRVDNVVLNGSVTPVPEPSQLAFAAALGLIGFGLYRRRSKE